MEPTITRYSEPSALDHAPKGTVCKRIWTLKDEFEIWVQTSADEEKPCWVLAGSYTSETPEHLIDIDIKASL